MELIELIQELGTSFDTFKAKNDLAPIRAQIDAMDAKINRPGFGGGNPSTPVNQARKSAIVDYIRLGGEHISADIKAELSVDSDPGGGYNVTPDVSKTINERIFETSPVRQLASIETIGSDALEGVGAPNDDDAGWVGERDTRNETSVGDFSAYRIPAHEMYAMPILTQKLADDSSINLETWLINRVSKRFSRLENTGFVLGNGVLKPRGFLTYTNVSTDDDTRTWGELQYIASGAAGAFDASNPADKLLQLVFKLKADYLQNAAWMMARSTLASIAQFKDGNGNYLLNAGNIKDKTPMTLMGFPVYLAEDMPAVAANSLSIAFGDFSGYQIVDRMGISVLRDPYTTKGQIKLYSTKRVGGAVLDFDAIKLMKFAVS